MTVTVRCQPRPESVAPARRPLRRQHRTGRAGPLLGTLDPGRVTASLPVPGY